MTSVVYECTLIDREKCSSTPSLLSSINCDGEPCSKKPKYFGEEYETDNVRDEYDMDDDELERYLCKRLDLTNLPDSGGSRILEGECDHRQKHILRCIRSSINLFFVRFCWEKSKKFSRRGCECDRPIAPPKSASAT